MQRGEYVVRKLLNTLYDATDNTDREIFGSQSGINYWKRYAFYRISKSVGKLWL